MIENNYDIKVTILFPLTDNNSGGGNQFLRSLKKEFVDKGVYSELADADVVLFNSHQNIRNVVKAKIKFPNKLFVHRVDGPIRLYNTMEDMRDGIVNATNKHLADATVFQSIFSQESNYALGMSKCDYSTIIYNGVDRNVFYSKTSGLSGGRIKIIASSWSSNINKGFDVYEYLDNHLDFEKYEMTFVGNSPVNFKNIRMLDPLNSKELANELRRNDIYISASRNDPCSNSVLEALACGLPVLCRNEGGHPELIKIAGEAGAIFNTSQEIMDLLDEIIINYDEIQSRIIASDIKNISNQYVDFFNQVIKLSERKRKALSFRARFEIKKAIFRWEHEGKNRWLWFL